MKKNVGSVDRVIRVVLGLIVLSLLFILEGNLKWLGLIGFIPLITGLIGYCPIYAIFKTTTLKSK
jgi:hypothetical protein